MYAIIISDSPEQKGFDSFVELTNRTKHDTIKHRNFHDNIRGGNLLAPHDSIPRSTIRFKNDYRSNYLFFMHDFLKYMYLSLLLRVSLPTFAMFIKDNQQMNYLI